MSKVLYITANVKPVKDSFSLTVGEVFINEYKRTHPSDEVTHLDLFKNNIPFLDETLIGFMYGQIDKNSLDSEHLTKVEAMALNLEQFINSDKYVFATPMWNLGLPPVVKAYFDNVAIVGKTFKYTENGPVGLLTGKKAMCIEASGGYYSTGPSTEMAHGKSYIKSTLGFLGISDISEITIEGTNVQTNDMEQIRQEAIRKAISAVDSF